MSELSPEDLDLQKRQAQAVLENPVFDLAKTTLAQHYIDEWRMADTVEKRELIWGKMKGLNDFYVELVVLMNAGPLPPTPEGA